MPVRLQPLRRRGFNLQETRKLLNGLPARSGARRPRGNPFVIGVRGDHKYLFRAVSQLDLTQSGHLGRLFVCGRLGAENERALVLSAELGLPREVWLESAKRASTTTVTSEKSLQSAQAPH